MLRKIILFLILIFFHKTKSNENINEENSNTEINKESSLHSSSRNAFRFSENPKIYNIGAVLNSGENVAQFVQVFIYLCVSYFCI